MVTMSKPAFFLFFLHLHQQKADVSEI